MHSENPEPQQVPPLLPQPLLRESSEKLQLNQNRQRSKSKPPPPPPSGCWASVISGILLGTGYKCWMRRGTRSATLVRHARHRPNATFCSTRNPRKRPAGALGSWSSLVPQAFCGLAGEVVRGIEPHSEANSWRFGSGAGRDPHCTVETANAGLYRLVVLMGESSSGREKAKVT